MQRIGFRLCVRIILFSLSLSNPQWCQSCSTLPMAYATVSHLSSYPNTQRNNTLQYTLFRLSTAICTPCIRSVSSITSSNRKQNNVLLDANYTACLADFGHASLVGSIPAGLDYLARSTARAGAMRWSAPEQIDGTLVKTTTQSDVYSFGCIALQASLLDRNVKSTLIFS